MRSKQKQDENVKKEKKKYQNINIQTIMEELNINNSMNSHINEQNQ